MKGLALYLLLASLSCASGLEINFTPSCGGNIINVTAGGVPAIGVNISINGYQFTNVVSCAANTPVYVQSGGATFSHLFPNAICKDDCPANEACNPDYCRCDPKPAPPTATAATHSEISCASDILGNGPNNQGGRTFSRHFPDSICKDDCPAGTACDSLICTCRPIRNQLTGVNGLVVIPGCGLTLNISASGSGYQDSGNVTVEEPDCSQCKPNSCNADADCSSGQACQGGSCVNTYYCDSPLPGPHMNETFTCKDDCPSGRYCYASACKCMKRWYVRCTADSDCDGGSCVGGTCQMAPQCGADSDCGGGSCRDGECIPRCASDADCEPRQYCLPSGGCKAVSNTSAISDYGEQTIMNGYNDNVGRVPFAGIAFGGEIVNVAVDTPNGTAAFGFTMSPDGRIRSISGNPYNRSTMSAHVSLPAYEELMDSSTPQADALRWWGSGITVRSDDLFTSIRLFFGGLGIGFTNVVTGNAGPPRLSLNLSAPQSQNLTPIFLPSVPRIYTPSTPAPAPTNTTGQVYAEGGYRCGGPTLCVRGELGQRTTSDYLKIDPPSGVVTGRSSCYSSCDLAKNVAESEAVWNCYKLADEICKKRGFDHASGDPVKVTPEGEISCKPC